MTYNLEFDARALKEWQKLGDTLRQQFKKKLATILLNPRVEANRLHGFPDCYKIKLRSSGYRLVYQVIDHEVVVFVVSVDKRERDQEGVRNFVFGHTMSKRCMYANQKETASRVTEGPERAA